MKISWTVTGDSLDFQPLHREFAIYYIKHFQKPFHLTASEFRIDSFKDLRECLANTNLFLERFRLPLFDIPSDLHSRNVLNALHESWVKLQIKHPNLSTIAQKISRKCKEDLDGINHLIHEIEASFVFEYCSYDLTVDQIPNTFGKDILRNGKFNITVHYDNLGRSTFDKWRQNDENIFDIDTNDYKMIGGKLIFDLNKSYEIPLPSDYVAFCERLKIDPIPDMLPLGNFDDKDIDTARELFLRNHRVEDNTIILEA